MVSRENVEDPVQCARGIAGVECSEHKVSRFRSRESKLNRFQVAHFSDHDYIRIFPQSAAQCFGEGISVGVNLPLIDVATLRVENVFDRIFEGEDVVLTVTIDEVNECGERGGFSRADGARYQHKPVVIAG